MEQVPLAGQQRAVAVPSPGAQVGLRRRRRPVLESYAAQVPHQQVQLGEPGEALVAQFSSIRYVLTVQKRKNAHRASRQISVALKTVLLALSKRIFQAVKRIDDSTTIAVLQQTSSGATQGPREPM